MNEVTQYGFNWGPATVERLFETKRHRVVGVRTPRVDIQIAVTPTGLVRVIDSSGREWKPEAP